MSGLVQCAAACVVVSVVDTCQYRHGHAGLRRVVAWKDQHAVNCRVFANAILDSVHNILDRL